MKAFTDITILLDRSGSMSSIKPAMEEAFNSLIREHRANPTTKVTLVQFDSESPYEVVYQCVPVSSVETLNLHPRGGTPLIDTLCTTIDKTGERLASMDEIDRPDQVLMIIITDGQENASTRYKRSDVATRISKQREQFKWNFVYLGANQDAIQEAHGYGIPMAGALTYTASKGGTRSMARSLAINTVAYASQSGENRGAAASAFTDLQRQEALDPNNDTNTTTTTGAK